MYQHFCFPIYQVPLVKRKEYIKIDRQRLQYLNFRQKINCMYCGYVNGFLAYALAIAGRTEQYWCSIKHKTDPGQIFYPPQHQAEFLSYNDKKAYETFTHKT